MTAETYGEKLLAEVKEEKLSEVQYTLIYSKIHRFGGPLLKDVTGTR